MFLRLSLCIYLIFTVSTFAQDADEPAKPAPKNTTITGRVYFEDTGRPVRRTLISLVSNDNDYGVSALTDGEGNYQVRNVPAGKYYPVVNSPGIVSPLSYANLLVEGGWNLGEVYAGFKPVVVDGIGNFVADIPAKRGGVIGGRVVYADGDPAIGVRVEILLKRDETFIPVLPNLSSVASLVNGGAGLYQTDDRGYFRSAGLPAGKYIIRITEKSLHSDKAERRYGGRGPGIYGKDSLLTMYYPDVFELSLAKVVDLEIGQESSGLSIVIPDRDLRKISGTVITARGQIPVRGANVVLTSKDRVVDDPDRDDPFAVSVLTGENGEWSLDDLPKGAYEIRIHAIYAGSFDDRSNTYGPSVNGNGAYRTDPKKDIDFADKVMEIVLDEKDLAGVLVELVPGTKIRGGVTVNGKDIPEHVNIALVNDKEQEVAATGVWTTALIEDEREVEKSFNRIFDLEKVPAGKFFLRISVKDDGFYVKSAKFGTVDLLTTPLEIKEGKIPRNIQIVLGTDTGKIQGRVTGSANEPIARAKLVLAPSDESLRRRTDLYRWVVADKKGEFEVKAAPGEYVVLFDGPREGKAGERFYKFIKEAASSGTKVTVESGGTHKVTIKAAAAKKS